MAKHWETFLDEKNPTTRPQRKYSTLAPQGTPTPGPIRSRVAQEMTLKQTKYLQ